jgi:hypothetical protein
MFSPAQSAPRSRATTLPLEISESPLLRFPSQIPTQKKSFTKLSLADFPIRRSCADIIHIYHFNTMSIESTTPPRITGYLLLFRSTNWDKYGLTEEQTRQSVDKINAWFDGLSATGKMVGAQPLLEEGVLISGKGGDFVTDGPFAEAKEAIGGYVLLNVDTMEEAVALAKTNPMHEFGLTTEVRPTASSCPHLHRIFSRMAEAAAA